MKLNRKFVWRVRADIGRIEMLGYARNYPLDGYKTVEDLTTSGSGLGLDVNKLGRSSIRVASSSCELKLSPDAEYISITRNLKIQSEIDDAFLLQLRGGVYSVPCKNKVKHPALLLNFHKYSNRYHG